jgi:glycosyltransferase involved in cell wall biosynthesis
MKIGVIMYQTSDTRGQELVAQQMVREFIRIGHEAYLITSPYHDEKRTVSHYEFERNVDGYLFFERSTVGVPAILVDGYPSNWPPRRIMFRNFVDALRIIVDRFALDVLITHSTLWNGPEDTSKFVLWRRTLQRLGLDHRDIVYCHMSHFQEPHPVRYSPVERAFRMAWNRLAFPQIFHTADLILVISPLSKEAMVKMGAREEQCYLFPGGVDEELYKDYEKVDFGQFRKNRGIPENKKIISYVGTIEERKNPLAVIRVARKLLDLHELHFVIAGHGSDQEKKVRNEARELKNVSYVGKISDEEKVQLIKGSYLNILMSRMEALGLTQLEFMYGGVPIITSAVGGQRWLVRDKVDGIHVNGSEDVEGAARAIKHLVENLEIRDEMSENAKRRAQEFTLEKLTRGLEQKLQAAFLR